MAYKQIFPNSLKIKNGMKTLYSLVERADPVSKQERGANNKNAKEYFTEPNPMFAGNALVGLCWGLAVARWFGSYLWVVRFGRDSNLLAATKVWKLVG